MLKNNSPLSKLRPILLKQYLDAFLVTNNINVQYLTEFTGDSTYLLITNNKAYLITDFRYIEQAQDETRGFTIIRHNKGLIDKLVELIRKLRIKRLGFEQDALSYSAVKNISKKLPSCTRLKPESNIIENLRSIKTPEEIQRIRLAINCASKAFFDIRRLIKPGNNEQMIAAELEHLMRKKGAIQPAFSTIVAADERASLPHARATAKILGKSGLLQFDWGACLDQYNSDTSRVIFLKKPSSFWQKIYAIVYEAQQRAIAKIKPGVKTVELDIAARGFIEKNGYGPNFGHGLGHGVGRMVHEMPAIKRAPRAPVKDLKCEVLQSGMVLTVEPGIYIPGKGGVRIEDMVLVTETGHEILTKAVPKDINQMIV